MIGPIVRANPTEQGVGEKGRGICEVDGSAGYKLGTLPVGLIVFPLDNRQGLHDLGNRIIQRQPAIHVSLPE